MTPENTTLLTLSVLFPLGIVLLPSMPATYRGAVNTLRTMGKGYLFSLMLLVILLLVCLIFRRLPAFLLIPTFFVAASFLFLLQGFQCLFCSVLCNAACSRAAAMLLGFLMIGSLFFLNPFLEMPREEMTRLQCIQAALYANPWLVAASQVPEGNTGTLTLLQKRYLYDISVIGSYYGQHAVKETKWQTACAAYTIIALGLYLLSAGILSLRTMLKEMN